jgi:hypothetical protein
VTSAIAVTTAVTAVITVPEQLAHVHGGPVPVALRGMVVHLA